MTSDLSQVLAEAATAGRARFETRDAEAVIAPATRRVRHHRAAVTSFAALGSVVLLAGVLWTADAVRWSATDTLTPATSSEPSFGADSPLGDTPWSTLALAAVASPRALGEQRADSAAGMICHHENPTDDPRVDVAQHSDVTISHASNYEDCTAVWFKNGPLTTDSNTGASTNDTEATLGVQSLIRNVSDRPLFIDRAAIFMWIETNPGEISSSTDEVFSTAILGDSMWSAAGTNEALLDSSSAAIVIDPGTYFNATATAIEGAAGNGALKALIRSGDQYTVTFWARIHEDNPLGDATYLVQLGLPHTFGGVDG